MEQGSLDQFVAVIPAFQDNYLFLVIDPRSKTAVAVDPGDAQPIVSYLNEHALQLTDILITHHHKDHTGGIKELKTLFPVAKVYCSQNDAERHRVPLADVIVREGDELSFGETRNTRKARVLDIPAHTLGHVAYLFESENKSQKPWLFCGDTLFGAGSGGLFEGTPEMLLAALKKIRTLSDQTEVFCAHEYTEKNLWVALQMKEENPDQELHYKRIVEMRSDLQKTVPLNLGQEKKINPFLRWDTLTLQQAMEAKTDLETLTKVRKFRDKF
jgi:hydroxyacylglutathione hydrolase